MSDFAIHTLPPDTDGHSRRFFTQQFGAVKGAFLDAHGDWWHRGRANRHAVLHKPDGAMAAYFATTPARIRLDAAAVDTLWWIDLMVDPAFRRRGLQTMMDDAVRGRPGLKLGFPNRFHATILARHGWQIRSFPNALLPLRPCCVRSVRAATGARGAVMRLAALKLAAPAWAWRRRLRLYQARSARVGPWTDASAAALAAVFERHPPRQLVTTDRSEAYFRWRFGAAPYRDDLRVVLAGPVGAPTHYVISRQIAFRGLKGVRLLDIWGDFDDAAGLRDALHLAVREAAAWGACQVTAFMMLPELARALRRLGFLLTLPVYFCYHDTDAARRERFEGISAYWTIADSDNDAPY